jgi:DNA-binding transcriptional ArsR family regulator
MSDDRADAVFSALSDPTRRQVMRSLSEGGEASASDLAARLPVSRQAVMKHLQVLADAGLVTSERAGARKVYRLTPEPMAEAVSWMADVGAVWDERLGALRRHLARRTR